MSLVSTFQHKPQPKRTLPDATDCELNAHGSDVGYMDCSEGYLCTDSQARDRLCSGHGHALVSRVPGSLHGLLQQSFTTGSLRSSRVSSFKRQ